MSNNSIGSILKTGSASDYISIKKQTTISQIKKDKNSLPDKKGADNFLFNRNNSNTACFNYLRTAKSFELLNNYQSGQHYCCDISFNNTSGLN